MLEHPMSLDEFHGIIEILQTLDIGLVVLDQQFHITLWNRFMENHSGLHLAELQPHDLFHYFPDIDQTWLRQKLDTVFTLRCTTFSSWELRPYLFKFRADRPFTGGSEWMYQNISIIPLRSQHDEITHVCLAVYDVTDAAVRKLALEKANGQLVQLSITDQMTGLYNRGYWEECLRNEFNRYRRTQRISTLMMLDIDFFKKVNDTYGHLAGDEVLRKTSALLQQAIRKTDIAGRYGGEEFGIILLETDEQQAVTVAERFRQEMLSMSIPFQGFQLQCTASIGLAQISPDLQHAEEWLQQADQALYHSKHLGRNRITLFRHGDITALQPQSILQEPDFSI